MSSASRFSEIWFRRGLWLVALIFAWFLISLGGKIVASLPKSVPPQRRAAFLPQPDTATTRASIETARNTLAGLDDAIAAAQLVRTARLAAAASAKESFANWIATRRATGANSQNVAILRRTHTLDTLNAQILVATQTLESLNQKRLTAVGALSRDRLHLADLKQSAQHAYHAAQRTWKLHIFLIRLALVLPLLGIAGWLFTQHRRTAYWPFVWGFTFFALYTFFVELAPYLPSYGGYIRDFVGLILTVTIGHYAIQGLARYLAAQKAAEEKPETERRRDLDYDFAQARLSKGVCPGCERPAAFSDPAQNHCEHCGIALFNLCVCNSRKSAFVRFCHACGRAAVAPSVMT